MKILGLEIKRIKKEDMPKKVKNESLTFGTRITDKGMEYLFGLKGSPFSRKKNQGYLHYDGIRMANGRIGFMWKDEEIANIAFIGIYTGDSFTISGIIGKQKIDMQ